MRFSVRAISRMIEGRPGTPVRAFDRAEPGLAGHAYLLPEGEGRLWTDDYSDLLGALEL